MFYLKKGAKEAKKSSKIWTHATEFYPSPTSFWLLLHPLLDVLSTAAALS